MQIDQRHGTVKAARRNFRTRPWALFPNEFVNTRLLGEHAREPDYGSVLGDPAPWLDTAFVYLIKPGPGKPECVVAGWQQLESERRHEFWRREPEGRRKPGNRRGPEGGGSASGGASGSGGKAQFHVVMQIVRLEPPTMDGPR